MRLVGVGIYIFCESNKAADTHANWLMDNGDSGPGAQWMALDLHSKIAQNHVTFFCLSMGPEGPLVWVLLFGYCGCGMNTVSFEKVSYGGRVLRNALAMTAEREALRLGIEYLTVLFPTEVRSFDFQVESTDRTVQYKFNAQSLRLFGLHWDVNDAHRAGANRLQNKNKTTRTACGGGYCLGRSPSLRGKHKYRITVLRCVGILVRISLRTWSVFAERW